MSKATLTENRAGMFRVSHSLLDQIGECARDVLFDGCVVLERREAGAWVEYDVLHPDFALVSGDHSAPLYEALVSISDGAITRTWVPANGR